MNNAQMSARVGLFFLLGVALLWVTFAALKGGSFSRNEGYTVTAAFRTLKELKAGDDVRMAGVKIGSVESTRLAAGRAEAVLRIQAETSIARDATATIAMAGLLGGNYISLDLGTAETGTVKNGEALRTRDTGDLNQIISDLGSLGQDIKGAIGGISGATGGSDPAKGPGLFQKLDTLVSANSENLTRTIENLNAITSDIRSGKGTLGRLVNDATVHDELVSTLIEIKKAAAEANAFVANAQSVIDQVKTGKGTLGTLIYDDATGQEIKVMAKNFRELSEKLNSGEGTFGKLLGDDTLYRDVQGVVKKADRALDSLSDQGPMTAVGVAAQSLF